MSELQNIKIDAPKDFSLQVGISLAREVGNALSGNYKSEAVELIETFLDSDDVEVIRLNPDLFEEAFSFYKQYRDKSWGLFSRKE